MTRKPILVWGEALADLVPEPGEDGRYRALLGGSGFNTALAIARCGAPVALCASLSQDAIGRRFRTRLAQESIVADWLGSSPAPTPLAVIEPIAADGAAAYRFHLTDTAFAAAPPLPDDPSAFAHLHLTSFGAGIGASGAAAARLMADMRAAGASISYDLNIRPPALPAREAALAAMADRIACCDLVKLSAEDEGWVGADWLAASLAACRRPPLLLRTDGADGAVLSGPHGLHLPVAAPPVAMRDSIGAGDVFMGALLAALHRRGRLGAALRQADRQDFTASLGFAARVASANCEVPGCDPPRLALPVSE